MSIVNRQSVCTVYTETWICFNTFSNLPLCICLIMVIPKWVDKVLSVNSGPRKLIEIIQKMFRCISERGWFIISHCVCIQTTIKYIFSSCVRIIMCSKYHLWDTKCIKHCSWMRRRRWKTVQFLAFVIRTTHIVRWMIGQHAISKW